MIKTKLRDYQKKIVEKWQASPSGCLAIFAEQRTGKTLTALSILDRVKPSHLLIVCPPKAVKVWQDQIHTHLTLNWDLEIKIHTYGEIDSNRKILRTWVKDQMIIADETHKIKNRSSIAFRRLRTVSPKARYRIALTGTPIDANFKDLWSQFFFVDPNILGTRWKDFEDRFCIVGGFRGKIVIGNKNKEEFTKITKPYAIRVDLSEVQRKPTRKIHKNISFPLEEEEDFYSQLENKGKALVKGRKVKGAEAVTLLIRLQQATGGFAATHNSDPILVGESKLEALRELTVALSIPVVICARFLPEIAAIEDLADRIGKTHTTISGKPRKAPPSTSDWTIIQIQSGVSIDLSYSDTMIFFSYDFSSINFQQMKSRIINYHSRKVSYYYLIAQDTVDVLILNSLRKKRNVLQSLYNQWR